MQRENNSKYNFTTRSATSTADKSPTAASGDNTFLNSTNSSFCSAFLSQNYSPLSPSDTASFDGGDSAATDREASGVLEYQQLYNSYTVCLAKLRQMMNEADTLRRQNDEIRRSNVDIAHRLSLLLSPSQYHSRLDRSKTERSITKSISARSSGYLKMNIPSHSSDSNGLAYQW